MTEREAVSLEHGFVLHQRAFRNTSQLVDVLTPKYGRIGLVARGSRRSGGNRALLQPFVPLRLSWLRRGELGRLTAIEAAHTPFVLSGERLLAGFYINELVLRMLARGDPNAAAYSCYSRCLDELAGQSNVARSLRLFELEFLHALGYGLNLECDASSGEPIQPDGCYVFEPESGPRAVVSASEQRMAYSGRELISLRSQSLDDRDSLRAARHLLERVLSVYLGERPLRSRLVFRDIVDRGLDR